MSSGCLCCGRSTRTHEQIAEDLLRASKLAAPRVTVLQEGIAEVSYELVGYCSHCATRRCDVCLQRGRPGRGTVSVEPSLRVRLPGPTTTIYGRPPTLLHPHCGPLLPPASDPPPDGTGAPQGASGRGHRTGSPPPTDPGPTGQLQPDGSVRIPPVVLEHAGLRPGDLVEFSIDETDAVFMRPAGGAS